MSQILLGFVAIHLQNGFFLEKEIQEAGVNPLTISWEGFVETQNTTVEWN